MAAGRDVYLVIGGDVFVGRHVVQRMTARGDDVSVLDSTQRHVDVAFYSGDIRNKEDVASAIQNSGATCIIHTLSPLSVNYQRNPEIFHQVNVLGTQNVIAAAVEAGVRKLVYHSSSGVVFDGHDIVNGDESLPYATKLMSPYTASRILAEQAVLGANGRDGLATVVIRPTGIFGVGDQELIVGAYDTWKKGTTHVQMGSNTNLGDKTYVSNVAHALVLACDKLPDPAVAGEVFFITNNDPRLFWDFMRALWGRLDEAFPEEEAKRTKRKPVVIPRLVAFVLAYVMGWVAWLRGADPPPLTPYAVTFATSTMYFTSEKAKRLLGYEPEVGVDEGLDLTVKWWKSEIESHRRTT
ncbi:3-beta hydroxysteroid dehydrogenase/isomerase family-domain-containing protein [Rhodofomes roseus]|uniref:3-beta hydroxysteroid dehydrogenase/isomerase family-domain-containing protein n=1 Tax=Rhodofomes roseus TaxID=34475 RepID=A0ABQ8KL61_9APHY|nr:3-beta hydroxysteroid dehydrogenase/isomerase family-domain-containing protein [Rhodofomes roseus]KAH9839059.1 3-beta hydroxysteroid dehydrogenase/isomerase family-domain-containing protein [Rhodofomes roseus]